MPSPRRRPPGPPPAPDTRRDRSDRGRGPFPLIVGGGLLVVAVVVVVAFLTGTSGDLPWGALAGVIVILGAMAATARRRERAMRDAFPDDED